MSLEKKIVVLKSSDGVLFEVDEAVALELQMIKQMIEDNCANNEIPLTNITSKTLDMVLEYCKKHVEPSTKSEDRPSNAVDDLKIWDANFVKVDPVSLFDLMKAANFLNNKGLIDLTCKTVADMIDKKTSDEIIETFNIQNAITVEEREEVRRQFPWAFR